MSCETSGNAEATPPDRARSLQTANKKYLGATRVAGIMALPVK
ncbi:hypothetical protein GGQ00_003269 [Salinibacter ruber]|nr:hypothetical protein [Salinibacter ruber]